MVASVVRIVLGVVVVLVLILVAFRVAITQPAFRAYSAEEGPRADQGRLRYDVEFLTDRAFPRDYTEWEMLELAADHIASRFDEVGARVRDQRYVVNDQTFRNIVARVGPDESPRIVVGAHYDVFGRLPGADDNASGTAGLIEVARLLVARGVDVPVELVAYSTEEPPFFGTPDMGSAVHARSLREAGVELQAMIGLEMIGFFTEHQPAPAATLRLLYPSRGDFILVAGRWRDRGLIARTKKSFMGASELPVRSYCGPTRIGTGLSDHASYWAQGYEAVMITDTAFIRNPNYHTDTDTADTLDYRRMAMVVDGVANAVIQLGASD